MKLNPLNIILGITAIIGGILIILNKVDLGICLVVLVILTEFIREFIESRKKLRR